MADAGLAGTMLELTVGGPAHGGACVARIGDDPGGRVVFVRHALPGERVRARVTQDRGGSFCHADAHEILQPSPDRVTPPCPHAGPGRCGGCDWQHATGQAQRDLKAQVVREQFARLARLDVTALLGEVEELPGGLLGWRTRNLYAVDRDGRPGLRRHASREVEHVGECPLGTERVGDSGVLADTWPGLTGVEVARGADAEVAVLAHRPGPGRQARGRRPPDRVRLLSGPQQLRHRVDGRDFTVSAGGFWQVHPAAAETFTSALLAAVAPQPGEAVLDLYAGAGLLTAALAAAVGSGGDVLAVESDTTATEDLAANVAGLPQARVLRGRVDAALLAGLADRPDGIRPDLVVLDPPRAGAGRDVVGALLALRPRAVGYVSCDPATLARDDAAAAEHGWRLTALRAFDAFPMTHHVECVALLQQ